MLLLLLSFSLSVPVGSPSRVAHVAVYVLDINQPSSPTLFILFLCLFVFTALSTVFHAPDNSPLFHSVLPAYFGLIGNFN